MVISPSSFSKPSFVLAAAVDSRPLFDDSPFFSPLPDKLIFSTGVSDCFAGDLTIIKRNYDVCAGNRRAPFLRLSFGIDSFIDA